MSNFAILTDSASNLTAKQLRDNDITAIPFPYFLKGKEYGCELLETFDDMAFYAALRNGEKVTTSQINPQRYTDFMRPLLEGGKDILFIGISSGISGAYASATIAKEQLAEEFPDRKIELVDSLGASLGEGLMVLKAAEYRKEGKSLTETAEEIRVHIEKMYQVFTVDDLMFLKRTGRLSNLSAAVGTVFGIKPLLKGNEEGKIVAFGKIRGRGKVIATLAEKYDKLVKDPETQTVGISYCDCKEDAKALAELINKTNPPKKLIIVKHEPATGSHLGPGALALYFEGEKGVRKA
ncbi:MAG: DegV family protein [Acutalibacteraceae bacterium]|nr:DegV family protein [Acutalibacteraceae bacterium]